MPGSYCEVYIHIVWSVKNREPLLTLDIEKSVIDIIKAKAVKYKARVIAIGNITDHIHVLVSIHPDTVISALIKEMKAVSSYFVNHNMGKKLYWQEGYWVLSIGKNALTSVRDYVQNQKTHHARKNLVKVLEESGDTGYNR
jgi:REP element-mobilizing transposase RayT